MTMLLAANARCKYCEAFDVTDMRSITVEAISEVAAPTHPQCASGRLRM
jgi:hypothetical protein